MGILWVGPLQWSTCMYFPLPKLQPEKGRYLRYLGTLWNPDTPNGSILNRSVFLNWIYIYIIYTYIHIYIYLYIELNIYIYIYLFFNGHQVSCPFTYHSKHPETWQLCPLAVVSFCNGKKKQPGWLQRKTVLPLECLWKNNFGGFFCVGFWQWDGGMVS